MKAVLLLVVILAAVFAPLNAQSDFSLPTDCEPETIKTFSKTLKQFVDGLDTVYGNINSLTDDGKEKLATSLFAISAYVEVMRAQCTGLTFTDTEPKVLGPVVIPEGIYKATATTEKYFIAELTVLSGECGGGSGRRLDTLLFNLSEGQAVNGAESVFSVRGGNCSVLIEVQNVRDTWTLNFEKIG